MNSGLIVGMATCLTPLIIILVIVFSSKKTSDNSCYTPLFMRIVGLFVLIMMIVGIIDAIITSHLALIWLFSIVFIVFLCISLYSGFFTKVVFENNYISVITLGIKKQYPYEAIQKVEVRYDKGTQIEQEIDIFFRRKKIHLTLLQVGFGDVKNLLIKKSRQTNVKFPIEEINRGKSKKKIKRQNKYK